MIQNNCKKLMVNTTYIHLQTIELSWKKELVLLQMLTAFIYGIQTEIKFWTLWPDYGALM